MTAHFLLNGTASLVAATDLLSGAAEDAHALTVCIRRRPAQSGGMESKPEVRHNAGASRYEIEIDGRLAVAEYEIAGDRQVFTHTLVPVELRGRGLAELLVQRALADARAAGRKVVPACSYVAKYIERHREHQDLLAQ